MLLSLKSLFTPFSVQLSLGCSYSSSQAVSWCRLVDLFITEGVCCRLQSLSNVINVGFVEPPKQTQTGLFKGSPLPRDAMERYTYNMSRVLRCLEFSCLCFFVREQMKPWRSRLLLLLLLGLYSSSREKMNN